MSEFVKPPKEITRQISGYGRVAFDFASTKAIPNELLSTPDHILFKSSNPADFQDKYTQIKDWTDKRYFLEIGERFLVAAKLIVPMALSDKKVSWIEIMEAKSPDGTADYLGAEYAEFLYPNYHQASLMLTRSRVFHRHREDDNHRWLSIRLNQEGQELRITDRPLEATIDHEVDSGIAQPIVS